MIRGSVAKSTSAGGLGRGVSFAGHHVRGPGVRLPRKSCSSRHERHCRWNATPSEHSGCVETLETTDTEVGTIGTNGVSSKGELLPKKNSNSIVTSSSDTSPPAYELLGLAVTPELAAIALVYFVQGILGLSKLAKDYFVKDELHLDPAAAGLIFTLSSFPWLVKPLWGFVSDTFPLFGYRRKSYLFLCGILGTVGGLALANENVVNTVPAAAVAFTLGSLSTAFADVVIDGVVVKRARESFVSFEKDDGNDLSPRKDGKKIPSSKSTQSTGGTLQSLCWGSVALGGIASAYYSGALIETNGARFVFGVTALFPLLIAGAALLVDETPVETTYKPKAVLENDSWDALKESSQTPPTLSLTTEITQMGAQLWSVGKRRAIWAPTAFVFLWQATPNPSTAMFYFTSNELGFTPEFMVRPFPIYSITVQRSAFAIARTRLTLSFYNQGKIALARAVAALAGVVLYNAYFKKVALKNMFRWSAILGCGLGLTQLVLVTQINQRWGIQNEVFALGDSVLLTVLGEISFLPVLGTSRVSQIPPTVCLAIMH